jgi:diaminopimelate decarboxylase
MIVPKADTLFIGDLPITELAKEYGEPLYIYDAEVIEKQCEKLRSALPDRFDIFYSMKANPNVSVVAALNPWVNGLEVSSLRELYIGLCAGFTPDRIIFVGPSKSEEELKEAVRKEIYCIVAESEQEVILIDQISLEMGRSPNVALRINPAFDAAGSKLKMGGSARQFGIDEEGIEEVIKRVKTLTNINIIGIHIYLGTRILDHEVAWKNTQYILELAKRLQEATGLEMRMIDVGGGLGVSYFAGEHDFDIEAFGEKFNSSFSEYAKYFPNTRFIMETGRYLVADSGIYVTRVRYVKSSRGQKFLLTSGGMNHHQATTSVGTLVKNHFPIEILNKMSQEKVQEVNVCGPLCTPADVLGKSVKMVDVEPGDLLGILRSGAYGLTASPFRFLSHDHPIEVLVYKGQSFVIRKQTTVDQILDYQVLVPGHTYQPPVAAAAK